MSYFLTLNLPIMKQKQSVIKQKTVSRDHGKDLYDTLLFLITIMLLLWYLKV
jgi:hypothetical protein